MSEADKTLQQDLDARLDELAVDFLGQIKGYDITHSAVVASKDGTDGVSVKINFGTVVREEYTWELAKMSPLEKQVNDIAKRLGFDFSVMHESCTGDEYTDWTSVVLGTAMR